jgi:hypothetical protein
MISILKKSLNNHLSDVGFKVLTAVVMKIIIFWDIPPLTFNSLCGVISEKNWLMLSWFSQALQTCARRVFHSMTCLPPFTSFPIQYSLTIAPFDAV